MKKLCCLLAVSLSCGMVAAQVLGTGAQVPGTGTYAFASFDNRGFDSINIGNLNTRFSIPIVSRVGRGRPFNYSIHYEGLIWQPVPSNGGTYWQPDTTWGFSAQEAGGITAYLDYTLQTAATCQGNPYSVYGDTYSNFVFHDQFGVGHHFNLTEKLCSGTAFQYTGDGTSTDGSGYYMTYPAWQVHDRYGNAINTGIGSATSSTDSNGNVVSNSNGVLTDTLGVAALTVSGNSPRTFTYPVTLQNNSATSASAVVSYRNYTVQTNFYCSGIVEYGANSVDLIDRITLADGSFYAFAYEPTPGYPSSVTARIASITLPTGGTITYAYSGGCGGINLDSSTAGLTRTTSDGTRTYTRAGISGGSSTTVQDEKGNQTVYDFVADIGSGRYFETHRQVYQNAVGGTPLLERKTCYNGANPNCDGQSLTLPITEADVTESYNGGSQTLTKNAYDASGTLLTSSSLYNGTTLLQSLTNTYNSLGEILTSVTQDGSSNTVASSSYGYDETAVTGTSGLPQRTTASSPAGNQTSSHVSTGSGTLDTTTAYYDTGMPVSTTAPGGFTTSYSYDSTQTFVTTTNLPTPSSGVALSTSATYDQQSTMPLSVTGMNGDQTQVSQYDALLRPLAVSIPGGGGISYSYSPNQTGAQQIMNASQSASPQILFDAYGRKSRTATFNGQSNWLVQWYQVDYCYDASGLLQFQPTPYVGSGFAGPSANKQCSGNGTAYAYDALGRVTSITNADGTATTAYQGRAVKTTDVNNIQKITQYDLLGRISGVCEISSNANMPSSGSPIPCGMDIAGTGFLTTCAYDLANHKTTVSQGAQTRIFQTDAAGRTTMTSEPERGITTYSYAYNSTGLQVTRTRPRANQSSATVYTTTTTQYDSLSRPVSISYADGSATNPLTTGKSFTYDMAQLPGIGYSTGYGKGRLIGAVGATVDVFSYDIAGNITGYFQCLPAFCGHSGTLGHDLFFSYGYDLVGNRTSDQYQNWAANGASVTTNYAYNAASQLTSISGGQTSQNNAAGSPSILSVSQTKPFGPSAWSYGNGLTGGQTYDTLGRVSAMGVCADGSFQPQCNGSTRYNFSITPHGSRVSSACDSVLGWCSTYGYDEFNRLISNSNGIPQSYTYSYDRYGNRVGETSSPSGPAPGFIFDASTNHINGLLYDAAGNMLTDGFYSYQYDAEGNVVNVNGGQTASYVYNSFNRRVEHRWAGNSSLTMPAVEDIAYNPEGQRVEIWDGSTGNQVQAQTYWGGQPLAYYKEGAIHFQHQDWHGSLRILTSNTGVIESGSYELAYGDAFGAGGRDIDAYHFAGLDEEYETGTQHAQFREYSPGQGRWMSPDPYDGSYDLGNPQSLNRYAYVLNNPLSYIDPSGQNWVFNPYDGCTDYWDGSFTSDGNYVESGIGFSCGGPGSPPTPLGTGNSGETGGAGGTGSAPSNNRHYSMADVCAASTLLNRGGPAVLDALGIIPVEGNLLSAGQLLASGASLGLSLASSPQKITGGQLLGAASVPLGVTGTLLGALKSVGSAQFAREIAPLAKVIPAVGNFVSAVSLFNDIVGADGVTDYYHTCLAGKN